MRTFNRDFNKRRSTMKTLFAVNGVITLIVFGLIVYLTYKLATNPEVIGQFFGKIVHGFNTSK